MRTKCIIIDDEPLAIELVKIHVEKLPDLEIVATCKNAIEGLDVLKENDIDLIFLDIQMPLITGLEFIKSLKNPPKIILTTAYREYALESYELDIVDYLLKPISFNRFFKAINRYFDTCVRQPIKESGLEKDLHKGFVIVNINKKYFKILLSDILYIESLKDYIRIHTPQDTIQTKESISVFESKLPKHFLRIHRSYIINLDKISAFTTNDVEIGRVEIPIGISYKNYVLKVLNP